MSVRRKSVIFASNPVCFSSFLVKASRGKSMFGGVKASSWQEREFTLYKKKILIYADKDIIKGEFSVSGCTVTSKTAQEVGMKEDALKFYFECKNDQNEILTLAADAAWRRDKWIEQIISVSNDTWVEDIPVASVYSNLPPAGEEHKTASDVKERLDEYCKQSPECGDCDSLHPTWASINNGLTICTACSGVHRSLGVHISFVQSLNMDYWSSERVDEFMLLGPNNRVNSKLLEYHVPESYLKASPNCSREDRER